MQNGTLDSFVIRIKRTPTPTTVIENEGEGDTNTPARKKPASRAPRKQSDDGDAYHRHTRVSGEKRRMTQNKARQGDKLPKLEAGQNTGEVAMRWNCELYDGEKKCQGEYGGNTLVKMHTDVIGQRDTNKRKLSSELECLLFEDDEGLLEEWGGESVFERAQTDDAGVEEEPSSALCPPPSLLSYHDEEKAAEVEDPKDKAREEESLKEVEEEEKHSRSGTTGNRTARPSRHPTESSATDYELARLERIRQNQEMMKILGLGGGFGFSAIANSMGDAPTPKRKRKKPTRRIRSSPEFERRRSTRLSGKSDKEMRRSNQDFDAMLDVETVPLEETHEYWMSNLASYSCALNSGARATGPTGEGANSYIDGYIATRMRLDDTPLSRIYSIDFSTKGAYLVAAGGHGGRVAVWGVADGICAAVDNVDDAHDEQEGVSPIFSFKAHRGWIADVQFVSSEANGTSTDCNPLLTASNDGGVTLWNLHKQRSAGRATIPESVATASHIHSGSGIFSMTEWDGTILTSSKSTNIMVQDSTVALSLLTPTGITTDRVFEGYHSGVVKCACFGHIPSIFASCGNDGLINVLDTRAADSKMCLGIETSHQSCLNSVAWSPRDEHTLLSASFDARILMFDTRKPSEVLYSLEGHMPPRTTKSKRIYRPIFIDRGRAVATTGFQSQCITLYSTSTGEVISRGSTEGLDLVTLSTNQEQAVAPNSGLVGSLTWEPMLAASHSRCIYISTQEVVPPQPPASPPILPQTSTTTTPTGTEQPRAYMRAAYPALKRKKRETHVDAAGNKVDWNYHCTISDEEKKILEDWKLRLQTAEVRVDFSHFDDLNIIRFIRSKYPMVDESWKFFETALAWRATEGAALLERARTDKYTDVLRTYWPARIHGVDKEGAPVYCSRSGVADIGGLLKHIPVETLLSFHLTCMEDLLAEKRRISDTSGTPCMTNIVIEDMAGLSMKQVTPDALSVLRKFYDMDANNYPANLKCYYVLNTPRLLQAVVRMVKPWIDPRTFAKVKFFGSDFSELLEVIDRSQLPKMWGGDCTCMGEDRPCLGIGGAFEPWQSNGTTLEPISIRLKGREAREFFVHGLEGQRMRVALNSSGDVDFKVVGRKDENLVQKRGASFRGKIDFCAGGGILRVVLCNPDKKRRGVTLSLTIEGEGVTRSTEAERNGAVLGVAHNRSVDERGHSIKDTKSDALSLPEASAPSTTFSGSEGESLCDDDVLASMMDSLAELDENVGALRLDET